MSDDTINCMMTIEFFKGDFPESSEEDKNRAAVIFPFELSKGGLEEGKTSEHCEKFMNLIFRQATIDMTTLDPDPSSKNPNLWRYLRDKINQLKGWNLETVDLEPSEY